jgi:hypothetical protein
MPAPPPPPPPQKTKITRGRNSKGWRFGVGTRRRILDDIKPHTHANTHKQVIILYILFKI